MTIHLKASAWLAIAFGVVLVCGETLRNWEAWGHWSKYAFDYVFALLLILFGRMTLQGKRWAHWMLIATWTLTVALFTFSLSSHLGRIDEATYGPIPHAELTTAIGILDLIALVGAGLAIYSLFFQGSKLQATTMFVDDDNRRTMERIAKCACGAVSLNVVGEPVAHSVCHCNNCKKRTGSAFGIGAYFPKRAMLGVTGETTEYAFHNVARNEDQQRYFCSKCGTTLYWFVSSLPDAVGIAGGCFADNPLGEPTITASTSKKLDWVSVPNTWRVWPE